MAVIEEVCTITAKGRTTVPKAIRQALGVGYGGRIVFRVEDRTVSVQAPPNRRRTLLWRRPWPSSSAVSRPGRRSSSRSRRNWPPA